MVLSDSVCSDSRWRMEILDLPNTDDEYTVWCEKHVVQQRGVGDHANAII